MSLVYGLLLIMVCVVSGLVGMSPFASAAELSPEYSGVLAALQGGKAVHVLSDLSRCITSSDGSPGPAVQGGMEISNFIVVERQSIAFSNVHETLDISGEPITEYIRYNMNADGKVTIRIAHLKNGDAEAAVQSEYVCQSPDGVRFTW